MQNPFSTLGVTSGASTEEIRAAYHARVKLCHPDGVQEAAAQQAAQDELVQLNLCYKEALRLASQRDAGHTVLPDARQVAAKLYEQGHLDSALRMLNKAPERDASWFELQGAILLRKGEAEAAHASFRAAIQLDPDNAGLREMALGAAVRMRKQKTLRGRMSIWARSVMGR